MPALFFLNQREEQSDLMLPKMTNGNGLSVQIWTRMEAKVEPDLTPEFPYAQFELLNVAE